MQNYHRPSRISLLPPDPPARHTSAPPAKEAKGNRLDLGGEWGSNQTIETTKPTNHLPVQKLPKLILGGLAEHQACGMPVSPEPVHCH